MPFQLDILALEPFYGGPRRAMLETLTRISRHRWILLKLPPRRIERRLTVAATWFSEQLSRHFSGNIDLLFTSEALNLADLYRFVPALTRKPSVVYFHDNQLPHVQSDVEGPLDFVNINTASASTEVWFNSLYHLKTFQARANALIFRHPEVASRNPLPTIMNKAKVMPPPVDLTQLNALRDQPFGRDIRKVFVDTRDADVNLLNEAVRRLRNRGEKCEFITVGPVEGLLADLPRRTISEQDDKAHAAAVCEAGIYLSVKVGATCDLHAVRALSAGCFPMLPKRGVYPELIPPGMYEQSLYDESAEKLSSKLQDGWRQRSMLEHEDDQKKLLERFNPQTAVKQIDDRIEHLVTHHLSNMRD